MIAPILRYPGAKWSMAQWIISYIPLHTTYLEPFFGSGAVFFNKQPSKVETINDIDGNVVNLFRVIREQPEELAALIEMTPWAREEYYASFKKTGDALEDARRFLVRCWQAFGTRLNARTGWRNDVQGKRGTSCVKQWNKLPMTILAITERLKDAHIENLPAIKLIERYAFRNVLIYADPPYVLTTRSGYMYANEMTDADHIELLDVLDRHPGPVLLSGYANEMYDDRLRHWQRRTHKAQAEKGRIRQEVLWINPVTAVYRPSLFG